MGRALKGETMQRGRTDGEKWRAGEDGWVGVSKLQPQSLTNHLTDS